MKYFVVLMIYMKYFIAHRGNVNGPDLENENRPEYIMKALQQGFDAEIDVWIIDNNIMLGHDEPQYHIEPSFLFNDKLWCHAKNFDALTFLVKNKIHTFSHDSDTHVLTSKGIIWAFVGEKINEETICVMPERCHGTYSDSDLIECLGICSDHIMLYKNMCT